MSKHVSSSQSIFWCVNVKDKAYHHSRDQYFYNNINAMQQTALLPRMAVDKELKSKHSGS